MSEIAWIATVRNKEAWVGETLKSLMDQKVDDAEFIFVDDASTDSTPLVLAHYARTRKNFKVITMKENVGVGKALNAATQEVTAPVILVASGDDVYTPERSSLSLDYLMAHPDISVYYGDFVLTDAALNSLKLHQVEPFVLEDYKKILPNGRANQTVPHGFCAYKTAMAKQIPYVETQKVGNDFQFFLDVAERGFKFGCEQTYNKYKKVLGYYRLLPNSVSVTESQTIRRQDYALVNGRN